MAEEKKQVTDDESVELGSTIQLSPHAPTNKVKVEAKGEDGTEYVSLDDLYEVKGNESLDIIAENCRQYLKHRKLNSNGFSALMISGSEGFIPGYDVYNGVKGAEGFIDAIKKGFIIMIKTIKRIVIAIINWIILKIRSLLGFEKTAKEIAIIREHSSAVKMLFGTMLSDIMPKGSSFDWDTYRNAIGVDKSHEQVVAMLSDKAKDTQKVLESYEEAVPEIKKSEEELRKALAFSKTVQSRYRRAVAVLREKAKNETVGNEDVIEFVTFINEEVGINMNFNTTRDALVGLLDKIIGKREANMFFQEGPKDVAKQGKEILLDKTKVAVSNYSEATVGKYINKVTEVLANPGFANFDPAVVESMKDLISVSDAEFIDELGKKFPKLGEVRLTYMTFSNTYKNYVNNINVGLNILGAVKGSIGNMASYANRTDRMMLTYMARDLRAIAAMDKENFSEDMFKLLHTDPNGAYTDRNIAQVDYEAILADKHPYYYAFYMLRREKAKEFTNKYKIFKKIDEHLKALGIKGIL